VTLDLAVISGDLEPGHWRFEAACAGANDRLFFPTRGSSTKAARAFCWGSGENGVPCPVRLDCLNHAIKNKENAGIWGGMSVRERRAEAQRRGESALSRELPIEDSELIQDLIKEDIATAQALLKG